MNTIYKTLSEIENDIHPCGVLSWSQLNEVWLLSKPQGSMMIFNEPAIVKIHSMELLYNEKFKTDYPNITNSIKILKSLGYL